MNLNEEVPLVAETTGVIRQNVFLLVLWLGLALAGWLGFQTVELVAERERLGQLDASQQASVAAAGKLRASLDSLASATARLADGGNANARIIVDELRKRGITINQNAQTLPAPSAP